MAIKAYLVGENGKLVKVSESGEIVTAPFDYSDPQFRNLDLIDTAYNFFAPRPGQQLVITSINAFANRNVTTQTQVDIYEADTDLETTVLKQLRRLDLAKLGDHIESQLLQTVTEGTFVNAKCDDDDVFLTIGGYYIPTLKDVRI